MAQFFQIVNGKKNPGDFSGKIIGYDTNDLYLVDNKGNFYKICHNQHSLYDTDGIPFWISIYLKRVQDVPDNIFLAKCGVQLKIEIPEEYFAFGSFKGTMPECIDMGDMQVYHDPYYRFFKFSFENFESVTEKNERFLFGNSTDSMSFSKIFIK